MNLFELVQPVTRTEIHSMSEVQITERIEALSKEMNWQYDIDPLNERVFDQGALMLKRIEEHLIVLFAKNKETAMRVWESECPFSNGSPPSFIQ